MSPRRARGVGVLAARVGWAGALGLLWLAGAGPVLASGSQSPTNAGVRVAQGRVHGNHTTPDEDVCRLAGVAEGDTLPAGGAPAVAARLEASGRFRRVEVRVRQRSIEDASDVALIVIVEEHPAPSAAQMPAPARWLRNTGAGLMWLPVVERVPGPAWFGTGWKGTYMTGVWTVGLAIANLYWFSGTPFYESHAYAAELWGFKPLEDQANAGTVMMLSHCLLAFGAVTLLFFRQAQEGELRQKLVEAGIDRDRVNTAIRRGTAKPLAAAHGISTHTRAGID